MFINADMYMENSMDGDKQTDNKTSSSSPPRIYIAYYYHIILYYLSSVICFFNVFCTRNMK